MLSLASLMYNVSTGNDQNSLPFYFLGATRQEVNVIFFLFAKCSNFVTHSTLKENLHFIRE